MPEKLARSVVVTPCCRHHSLTERPLLRHSWICAAHSCSSARCFNSALVILTSHNTTVAKPFATFRYYCLMCVYARLGLTVTFNYLKGDLFRNEKLKHEQYNAKRIQTTPKHLTLDLFNTGCWRAGTICARPPCLPKKRGRRRQSMAQSVHLDH